MTPELHLLDPTLAVSISMPQWAVALLVVVFLFISVVMILVVLIQRPQGGGLSGAFGGGGSGSAGQTAFGARTGDALTITTITIFILYLLAAVFLNYTIAPPSIENPTITAASQTTVEGEADDSTTFIELPPVIVGSPDEDAATTIDPDAPVGPLPEAPSQDSETPSDDAPSDTPSDG